MPSMVDTVKSTMNDYKQKKKKKKMMGLLKSVGPAAKDGESRLKAGPGVKKANPAGLRGL